MNHTFGEREWNYDADGENLDIVREHAAFLQEMATLIATIPGVKQPSKEDHTFGFTSLPFSTPFEFPKVLTSEVKQIDDFFIYIGDAHKAESTKDSDISAYLSIDFNVGDYIYQISSAGNKDAEEYILYKFDGTNYTHVEPNEAFETRYTQVGVVTRAEVNALLMSIVYPNAAGDYSAYADKDLQSCEAFESLCELLSQQALTRSDSYQFMFDNEETDFYFVKENGQTTSFSLHYYDERRMLPISVEYDIGTDSSLRFCTIEANGDKQPFIPTAAEVLNARIILMDELSQSEPALFEKYRGEVIEPTDGPADHDHTLSNELSGLVDTVLDELGLNPPYPGA